MSVKELSENSADCYAKDATKYYNFIFTSGIPFEAGANGFIMNLKNDGTNEKTIARYISSLRAFFNFLTEKKYVSTNPFLDVKLPKLEQNVPQVLTVQEIQVLLAQPDISTPDGLRDKIVLELLYQSGLMVTQLLSLNTDNINLQLNVIALKSGVRERIIPMYPPLTTAISEYLSGIRPAILKGRSERALLINMRGNRLTRQAVFNIVDKYAQSAQIEFKVFPRMLRQSLAFHLVDNNADVKELQEALGVTDASAYNLYNTILKIKYDRTKTRSVNTVNNDEITQN